MAKEPPANGDQDQNQPERKRRAPRGFPSFGLEDSLVIGQAIADNNAGKPYSKLSLAESIKRKPDSSAFRNLLSASLSYGLTEGSFAQSQIKLTALGIAVTMPQSDDEQRKALVKAARSIPLYEQIYTKFDQNKLPPDANFRNTLIREHSVEPAYADEFIKLFKADGKFTGLIRNVAGSDRVDLQQEHLMGGTFVYEDDEELDDVGDANRGGNGQVTSEATTQPPPPPPAPEPAKNAIFIGHGKDHTAVEQLRKLLEQMGVKGVTVKDEAHAGRPISQKVADCMRDCSAAIFIASADDDALDADGKPIKHARQNVIYELGAASFVYGQRIVIFKENGVEFPSDFSDLGYIPYDKGHLADKFAELIGELVKLKAVRIQAGGE